MGKLWNYESVKDSNRKMSTLDNYSKETGNPVIYDGKMEPFFRLWLQIHIIRCMMPGILQEWLLIWLSI